MNQNIELKFNDASHGGFYIFDNGIQMAELEFTIDGNILNAYHTGVKKEMEGQGVAGKLFDTLIDYARNNSYKIIPTCPYVLAKMKRNADAFADVWQKDDKQQTDGVSCGIRPK